MHSDIIMYCIWEMNELIFQGYFTADSNAHY
jgi:hypothetical protein